MHYRGYWSAPGPDALARQEPAVPGVYQRPVIGEVMSIPLLGGLVPPRSNRQTVPGGKQPRQH